MRHVVLVTGGSGFLGQHVIKHLQLYGEDITEIRVLDVILFEKKLDYESTKPVTSIVGSILDIDALDRACKDVFAVFHLASKIDYSLFPDTKGLAEINVNGTENVIRACKNKCVPYLLYCGSLGSFTGYDEVKDGTETTVPLPKSCSHGIYGNTKYTALQKVLASNGSLLLNGEKLSTIAILPTGMYGELDPTNQIRRNRSVRNGVYYRVMGAMQAKIQFVYVGNVAMMFVNAFHAMQKENQVTGQYYFAVDDSPVQTHVEYRKPYIAQDIKVSDWYIPHRFINFILVLIYYILCFVRLFQTTNFPLSPSVITFVNTTFYVRYDKARTLLGYRPLYDFETSMSRTLKTLKD